MKRGFSTVACMGSTYKEVLLSAKKNNMQGVEIRLDSDNRPFGLSGEELLDMVKEFSNAGVSITNLGTNIDLKGYNEVQIQLAKECIETAKLAGAKGIRIFLGNFVKLFSDYGNYDYEGIVKSLQEICRYAQNTTVEVWIETHNEFSQGKVLKKLIDDVDSNSLKIIWDIIHPYEYSEHPEETMKYLSDRIAHVHIKDGSHKADEDAASYTYTQLGKGELPISEIVNILIENNYDGYLSLEWESAWKSEIRDIYNNLDDILDDYNKFMDNIL